MLLLSQRVGRNKPAVQRGAGGNGDPNPSGNAPWLGAGAAVSAGAGMWLLVQSCASSASLLNAEGVSGCPGMGLPLWHSPGAFYCCGWQREELSPVQSLWFTGRAH